MSGEGNSQQAVTPAAVRIENISKRYAGVAALDDVSFEVASGQIHALVGGNGSGKSTMVKVLAGVVAADAGRLVIDGHSYDATRHTAAEARRVGLRFVHQQQSTFDDLTVAENLAIGNGFESGELGRIHWRAQRARAAEVLERFGIEAHPDDRLGSLSPARRTTVAIARALQDLDGATSGILVLDEPTASLPAAEVDSLLASLIEYARAGQTIVYVSHRLEEILKTSDTVTVLRDGQWVATAPTASFTHDSLVEMIVGRSLPPGAAARNRPPSGGDPVLSLQGLRGGTIRDVSLHVQAGEVVGLAGLLGSGRSSLLRMVFGAQAHEDGEIILKGEPRSFEVPRQAMDAGIAYVPEDRAKEAMFADLGVRENFTITSLKTFEHLTRLSRAAEMRATDSAIDRFGIKTASADAPLASLSGGNQQKVMLARWMDREPSVLLLDEPTQGVDVGARAEIHELVRAAASDGTAVLVASSDFEELAMLCDRVLLLRDGVLVGELSQPGITDDQLNHALLGVKELVA